MCAGDVVMSSCRAVPRDAPPTLVALVLSWVETFATSPDTLAPEVLFAWPTEVAATAAWVVFVIPLCGAVGGVCGVCGSLDAVDGGILSSRSVSPVLLSDDGRGSGSGSDSSGTGGVSVSGSVGEVVVDGACALLALQLQDSWSCSSPLLVHAVRSDVFSDV